MKASYTLTGDVRRQYAALNRYRRPSPYRRDSFILRFLGWFISR